MTRQSEVDMQGVRRDIVKLLDDKKTVQIADIDVQNDGRLSDACIIASGTSARQVDAVAGLVYRYFKAAGLKPRFEGNGKSGWVMIEAAGLEVHLFKPELREYYDLEALLAQCA